MKYTTLAVAIMAATAGVAVSAQEAAQNSEQPPKEKKICRTEKATGSLTRRTRVCLTAEQWRELNSRTKRGLDEMGRNASGAQSCNPASGEICR